MMTEMSRPCRISFLPGKNTTTLIARIETARRSGLHLVTKVKEVVGACHICGVTGPLTYEHIPPKAAFNDARILESDIERFLHGNLLNALENPKGKTKQRGAGDHTLCFKCNSDTGAWYAPAYVELVKALYPLAHKIDAFQDAHILIRTKPLNILKQILAMFCSACGPNFAAVHPDLVRYILNRDTGFLPDDIGIFISLFSIKHSRTSRQSGISGRIDTESGESLTYSEICFPPFNLVMTLGSGSPHKGLFNITWFQRFRYDETSDVRLSLRNLPVNSFFPSDYRTYDELADIVRR